MQRMEAQLASLTAMVQSAVVLKSDGSGGGSRPGSARSNSSLVSDTSCSIKSSKYSKSYEIYCRLFRGRASGSSVKLLVSFPSVKV